MSRIAAGGRRLIAGALAIVLLLLTNTGGRSAASSMPAVTIQAVSGYAGHAFVYARVSDSTSTYPAPTGTDHQSPYYAEWVAQSLRAPSCPWIWAVYVYSRATDVQVNVPPPNAPSPNFGTTTIICASPSSTPVEQPPEADASARLDLDLRVAVSPAQPIAGSVSTVSGVLSSALTQDLNLYLSLAIEDWSVRSWFIDFGDGQSTTLTGALGNGFSLPHVYQATGRYDVRAIASIEGHAQAAIYDRYGTVHLVRRRFSVEVGNDSMTTALRRPSRSYVPPLGLVAVIPAIGTAPVTANPFRHVEALRGALTTFWIRLLIEREALLLIDGVPKGFAQSRLVGWRFEGPGSDAPPGSGTTPEVFHDPTAPLQLQWNSPDRVVGTQPQDYIVPVTLFVQSHFPDGHAAIYALASSFSVSVDFAAESG